MQETNLTGTVKFFNVTKGFGFIKLDNSDEEIFVHVTGLESKIKDGDPVEFDVKQGPKGENAVNVRVRK
jgi:CspA family cold shock protein